MNRWILDAIFPAETIQTETALKVWDLQPVAARLARVLLQLLPI